MFMKFIVGLYTLIVLAAVETKISAEAITNVQRTDGFGAQYQTLIYTIIYAELHGLDFFYSPFVSMEHNYDQDPQFLEKKEVLVNLNTYFPLCPADGSVTAIGIHEVYELFEYDVDLSVSTNALKIVKRQFRANKERDHFGFNIAVHIRRSNPHDTRVEGTTTPDEYYTGVINSLREEFKDKEPLIHIYSQGDIDVFKRLYPGTDIIYHINEPVEETFTGLVLADVLVTATSSFSYVAALLSDGIVYYTPFWHPPLKRWKRLHL